MEIVLNNKTMETKTNGNDLAFAKAAFYHPDGGYDVPQAGLTKREYFAAMAMQGLLTRVPVRHNDDVDLGAGESVRIAAESRIMADLLIEQLNKGNNGN